MATCIDCCTEVVAVRLYQPPKRCQSCNKVQVQARRRAYELANPEKTVEAKRRNAEKHRDRYAEGRKRHYLENKEKIVDRAKQWQIDNPERNRAHRAKQAENGRERKRLRSAEYYQSNREKCSAANSKWKKNNRLKVVSYTHARRGILKRLGKLDYLDFADKCNAQNGRCLFCGEVRALTIDHIMPVERGGGNEPENIQALCRLCNSSKGTRTNDEYFAWKAEREKKKWA